MEEYLTISGFYYISLDRLTGAVEGWYYDSKSHPYQSLTLSPAGVAEAGGFSAAGMEFR
jgi:hypothetical protein